MLDSEFEGGTSHEPPIQMSRQRSEASQRRLEHKQAVERELRSLARSFVAATHIDKGASVLRLFQTTADQVSANSQFLSAARDMPVDGLDQGEASASASSGRGIGADSFTQGWFETAASTHCNVLGARAGHLLEASLSTQMGRARLRIPLVWADAGETGGAILSLDGLWSQVRDLFFDLEGQRRRTVCNCINELSTHEGWEACSTLARRVLRSNPQDEGGVLDKYEAWVYSSAFDSHMQTNVAQDNGTPPRPEDERQAFIRNASNIVAALYRAEDMRFVVYGSQSQSSNSQASASS